MEIRLAESYGFCFGVKRAIKIAEETRNSLTLGPLIHNSKEIERLGKNFNVHVEDDIKKITSGQSVIIRTHGVPKSDLARLKDEGVNIIDATCPFVTKPQQIVEEMSNKGYSIVIFGDANHPEIKGVMSYAANPVVVLDANELVGKRLGERVAVVSQTTRNPEEFLRIVNFLIVRHKEVRVFNTICNATFDNQDAARELSKEADVMIVVGGKNSSNTKQLLAICQENCKDSYLIEGEDELQRGWFEGKRLCGVTAGASTPDWIIAQVVAKIREYGV